MTRYASPLALALSLAVAPALAAEIAIPMTQVDAGGTGPAIGMIRASDSPQGLVLTPALTGLPPGPHGLHVHELGNCAAKEQDGKMVPALAAGGHYDPDGSKAHHGPIETGGHRGDLPVLVVGPDGTASTPVVAPRLTVADLRGRSLMIHAGGDTYSDQPQPLGGGGARIACGLVPPAR